MTSKDSKHSRSSGKDSCKKSKKRHKDATDSSRKRRKDDNLLIVDDDPMDDDMWVEKRIDLDIPQMGGESLRTEGHKSSSRNVGPAKVGIESAPKRDEWMVEPLQPSSMQPNLSHSQLPSAEKPLTREDQDGSSRDRPSLGETPDYFLSLGMEVKKKSARDVPDPDKLKISSRELNTTLNSSVSLPVASSSELKSTTPTPGGPGWQWRMMRLRRVFETAEEENTPVEQVAIDRFGSLEAFEEAKEERRILDERDRRNAERERGRSMDRKGKGREGERAKGGERWLMFNDMGTSGASSRSSSFRRPGGAHDSATPTPSPPIGQRPAPYAKSDTARRPSQVASPLVQSHTPIPSVMTPPVASSSRRALSPSSLNRLQAKVLRAKLMGSPEAEALEKNYEDEVKNAYGSSDGGVRKKIEVLPTLDAMGRLYDVGTGPGDEAERLPGNRKKTEKFETRDPKTGELLRYNADDDTMTLQELLRQEKFGAGMSDQKNFDAQFAKAVMGDVRFENDLDYMDDNAERLSRKKMRSDAIKRQFAIHDYKRTQKVLASCLFCFGEDDSPPKAPVIAMGTRAYLSCTTTEELVPGHCLIVPIQHHLNMLEGDDDVWDEVRNFMKCLMRMFADEDKGVVFYETVITLKWQKHAFIECVPLPWEQFEIIPQYFKESILQSEAEWSQHKKLIDFSARPGGFRRAMVPNLPYFMVQFDYKGEKGYGHVIEGAAEAVNQDGEDGLEEGEKGGGEFPRYFASEIIGNVLDIEPRKWRRPRRMELRDNKERVREYRKRYACYDWTGMIEK